MGETEEVYVTDDDARQWIEDVKAYAKQYPDAVYVGVNVSSAFGKSCSYFAGEVRNGARGRVDGCLIGQAVVQLLPAVFQEIVEDRETMYDGVGIDEVYEEYASWVEGNGGTWDVSDSTDAFVRTWLTDVQNAQDSGDPWSKAVEFADDRMLERELFGNVEGK